MRGAAAALMLGVLAATVVPAMAQDEDQPLISKTYWIDVEPAQILQFEQALREHMQRHATTLDPWAWHTWQVVNGRDHGSYVIRSHGHRWQDFDQHDELQRLDRADFESTVAVHIRSISSSLEALEPGLSTWSATTTRPALVEVTVYELDPAGYRDFYFALGKLHDAVKAKHPDVAYAWSVTVNGSDGPTMTLAVPHGSWAELASRNVSPWDAVEEQYGVHEATLLRGLVERSIRAERSFVLAPRPDISYEPRQ